MNRSMPRPTKILSAMLLLAALALQPAWSGAAETPKMNLDAAQQLFDKANTEYQQQHYEQAHELYAQIIRAGIESPQVYYNMGNASARLGRTGEAVLYYERAKRFSPRNPDVAANLKKIAPADNDPKHFVLFRPFFWILDALNLREWMGIFFAVFFVAAICGAVYFSVPLRGLTPWLRRAFYSFGVLTLALGFFAMTKYYQSEKVRYSVVMKPNAPVYSGPDEKFSQLVSTPEGTKVRRLGFSDPTWAQVVLMDGQKGFTLAQNLQPI